METSIFLAKLIGPVLFVTLYPDRIARVGAEVLNSDALLLISGAITFPAGLAIVIAHPVWAPDWRGLITALGWIITLAGAARMLLPGPMKILGGAMLRRRAITLVPGVLMAVLGAYLAWKGYFLTPQA